MTPRHTMLAVLTAAIWGFNFVVIQWGMAGVPPLLFGAVRFLAVAAPAVLLLVPRPRVAAWKIAAVGTFLSLGQFAFLYVSIDAGMPAGLASLVLQSQVVITILAATVVLRELPTRAQLAGVLLGSAGLVVVAAGRDGHVPLGALVLCVCAACSWAVGNVVVRALKVPGGLSLTVWSALVAPVPMVALSLLVDGPDGVSAGLSAFGWKAVVSTAYTAVLASFVGYGAWNSLLARYPSSQVVPWVLLVPPVGIVSAWLCLGETPGAAELAGGGVLVLGVLVAQGRLRRSPRASVADEPASAAA
ncbi:EamA family transporter [Nocardioides halotolerans]|jgi:O-acetylserine/cysteine efflux transporter|uniref:EamA family transporter n=1 Tax=Nocardioides halotolerans TaxID=433660 RepID=UPI0004272622|nr:EamA family transporter [Nocardioides halotolerans]